jgi:glycogen synthase
LKITLCANRFAPNIVGGGEVMVHSLAVALRDRGHDVSILTLSNERRGTLRKQDGLDVHELPNLNVYDQFHHGDRGRVVKMMFGILDIFNPLMFLHTWKRLGEIAPDVLCTNTIKGIGPALWFAARVRGVPIVHVNHDYWLLCPRSTMFRNDHACESACGECKMVSRPKAWFSRVVDRVVSVTGFVDDRHRDEGFFPNTERKIIHLAPEAMRVSNAAPAVFRAQRSPFRVGFIGRTDTTKGIEEFFASVAEAAKRADIEVHIAGKDNEQRMPGLIARYPQLKVTYHGFMKREVFFDLVDLTVLTSMWDEPGGTVSVEAWEFCKPSATFATGGLPEVFERVPELVVPRGDVDAMGALIARLANENALYEDLARRCHAERSRFTPRDHVDEFEAVFYSAARQNAPRTSVSAGKRDIRIPIEDQAKPIRKDGVPYENKACVDGDDPRRSGDRDQRPGTYASVHSRSDRQ